MWLYNNKEFDYTEEQLKPYQGFVYCITEVSTGMKYIGKKFFWAKKRRIVKGKKKGYLAESDWKQYYGSNVTIKEKVEQNPDDYRREILRLCATKGECSYFEAKLQFENDVLIRDDYYNGIINCRINQTSVAHLREKK